MHRHHVREFRGPGINAPVLPIEEQNVTVLGVPRQKTIPDVRVAVNDRQVAVRKIALEQMEPPLEKSLVKLTPLRGHQLTVTVGETSELFGETS